jgi:hypothetical protein
MTENEGSPGAHVVNIDVAIDIIDACSDSTLYEWRLEIHRFKGPYRAVHPARNELLCLLKEYC